MPISDEHVGKRYAATSPYLITASKIEEFARALGDESPAYAGQTPVAPPTFAAVLAARAWEGLFADQELDLELARTIHYDQRFEFERPLRAGDEITAALTIDKVRRRGASAFITVSVELTDGSGQRVCTATSTLLHTWPTEGER